MDVWCVDLDAVSSAEVAGALSDDERVRARSFRSNLHTHRFVACRGILREILGSYLQVAPDAVRFDYGPAGKPELKGGSLLRFNLSHAGGLAMYAVTWERALGIDVERVSPLPEVLRIAEFFFTPRERAILAALDGQGRTTAFFRHWTRKEAYLKALGLGLSVSASEIEIGMLRGGPTRLVRPGSRAERRCAWSIHELAPAEGVVASVVVEGPPSRIRCRSWTRPSIVRESSPGHDVRSHPHLCDDAAELTDVSRLRDSR